MVEVVGQVSSAPVRLKSCQKHARGRPIAPDVYWCCRRRKILPIEFDCQFREVRLVVWSAIQARVSELREAYPAVPGYSIPPFGPLWVNKAPIGRQIGIAASLATKKVRPASEASKTSAWAIVAVTWDSGISL